MIPSDAGYVQRIDWPQPFSLAVYSTAGLVIPALSRNPETSPHRHVVTSFRGNDGVAGRVPAPSPIATIHGGLLEHLSNGAAFVDTAHGFAEEGRYRQDSEVAHALV